MDEEIKSSAEIVEKKMKDQEAGPVAESPERAQAAPGRSPDDSGAPDSAPLGSHSAPPADEAPPAPAPPQVGTPMQRINIRFVPVPDQGIILMQLTAPIQVLMIDRNMALTIARDLRLAANQLPIIVRPGAGIIGGNGHGTGLKAV